MWPAERSTTGRSQQFRHGGAVEIREVPVSLHQGVLDEVRIIEAVGQSALTNGANQQTNIGTHAFEQLAQGVGVSLQSPIQGGLLLALLHPLPFYCRIRRMCYKIFSFVERNLFRSSRTGNGINSVLRVRTPEASV